MPHAAGWMGGEFTTAPERWGVGTAQFIISSTSTAKKPLPRCRPWLPPAALTEKKCRMMSHCVGHMFAVKICHKCQLDLVEPLE